MITISKIRSIACGKARLTSLSRNTIKKWLRALQGAQPKCRRRSMPTKVTPFAEALAQALKADAHKQERRSARAFHVELQALGYDGGYTRLNAMTTELRLGPLPKTAMVKITIAIPEKLKMDLDRYAELHSARWCEPIDAIALIPHMLEAFMARDRGFRKARTSSRLSSTAPGPAQ